MEVECLLVLLGKEGVRVPVKYPYKNNNLKALFIISPQNLDLENSALKG